MMLRPGACRRHAPPARRARGARRCHRHAATSHPRQSESRPSSLRAAPIESACLLSGSGYGTTQPGLSATDWHLHIVNKRFNRQVITNLYGATSQFSQCCMHRWRRAMQCLSWCGLSSTTPQLVRAELDDADAVVLLRGCFSSPWAAAATLRPAADQCVWARNRATSRRFQRRSWRNRPTKRSDRGDNPAIKPRI
jgi:hypothetical protein